MPDRRKVLIVEDDPSFAEFLEVTVRAAGHEPHVAHDGVAAMEAFRSLAPDLVFLDMLVPKKDGYTLCGEIRALDESRLTPIVVVTGIYKREEYKEEARLRFGIRDYLVKPVRIMDVWRVLDRYLENGHSAGSFDGTAEADGGEGKARDGLFPGRPVSEEPLARVLHDLHEEHRTGLLFLKDRNEVALFFIDRGELIFARSNDSERRLANILAKRGVIDLETARRAESLMRKSPGKTRMGQILVGMGCLSRHDLEEILQEQLEDLILEGFRREGWKTHFVEGDLPSEEEIRLERSTRNLILKGIREMADLERVRRHLPSLGAVPATTGRGRQIASTLDLTPYEQKMLALCDGTRTVRKILSIARLAPVEMERLLFAFLHTGVVEVVRDEEGGEGETDRARSAATLGEALGAGEVLDAGRLGRAGVPSLLMRACADRRSGILEIQGEAERAWLYFDAGQLVFVGSTDNRSRLGEVLEEGGLVAREDLERVAETGDEDGRGLRLGQRLVEEGLLTLEELSWAMTFQMQKRIQSLLDWRDAKYLFRDGPFPTDETITIGLDTRDVVLEGLRRMDPDQVKGCLPPGETVLRRMDDGNLPEGHGLTPEEVGLLERIPDGATVSRVLDLPDLDPAFLRRGLYALLTLGVLGGGKTEPASTAEADETEDALEALLGDSGEGQEAETDGNLVPRLLLDQSVQKQQEMQREMYEIYKRHEALCGIAKALGDEIRTIRSSSLMNGANPDLVRALEGMLEQYLKRIEDSGPAR